ncbi:MAG: cadherin-like domain-containing protein [Actinomycetales bacterium]|nr:cadherin-like domain-containing protein [Actinomycetales bacterium]
MTNDHDGLFGRLNKSAEALDSVFMPPGGAQNSYDLDVRQDRSVVVAWDRSGGRLLPVDVSLGVALADRAVAISPDGLVDLRGGSLAVLDVKSGKIRATRYAPDATTASLAVLDSNMPSLAELGASSPAAAAGSAAAVGGSMAMSLGVDGGIHAVSSSGKVLTVPAVGEGFGEAVIGSGPTGSKDLAITSVGTRTVVLDRASGALSFGDRGSSLPQATPEAFLQAPSPDRSAVIIATPKALFAAPLNGDPLVTLFDGGTGTPAAPVVLGDCVYAAWAGTPGAVVRSCDGQKATPITVDRAGTLSRPVFRVNRDLMVINDSATGRLFDVESSRSLDNWDQVKPQVKDNQSDKAPENQNPLATQDPKPKASPDRLGARPGRATVMHVLDNDSDPAGRVLAISAVSDPGVPGASATVSPDRQTILVTLPPASPDLSMTYTVDNGTGNTAQATLSVESRQVTDNKKPEIRAGFTERIPTVVAGRTVSVPIVGDWRDYDGDSLTVVNATVEKGAASTSPDGRIEFGAPLDGNGTQTIKFKVTDGVGEPADGELKVVTQAPAAATAVAAVTLPDVVRGEVGKAFVVSPLVNDLPGSDPNTAQSLLALAGNIAPKEGLEVETDLRTGTATLTGSRPGTFFLEYSVAFGSSPFAQGQIRVDVANPPAQPLPPVAMPDMAALRGQVPAMIDVLANDVDPAGMMLTVQSASVADAEQLEVAVIRGRWVRITPLHEGLSPSPQIVHYTVSNGSSQAVSGDISVTQLGAVTPDAPRTRDDIATVRDGDSVLIPVLSNDSTESGAPLRLASNVVDGPNAGQFRITDPALRDGGVGTDLGTAYLSGDSVRYVAPVKVETDRALRIEYVAETYDGDQTTGSAYVTVKPQPSEKVVNQAPLPQTLEARLTAGDQITIPVPSSGQDPDGDSTTVAGVGSGPVLGRIKGSSPTSFTYEAYPTSAGTDQFTYVVTDRYGKTGSAVVRISVVPAGETQPPVAVPDVVTAKPGAKLNINIFGNDLVGAGDPAEVVPLERFNPTLPPGVALETAQGPLLATTQDNAAPAQVISYALSGNGGQGAPTTVTIRSREGFNNPPVAVDAVAKVDGATPITTVDVLSRVYDVDGPESGLKLTKVTAPGAVIAGGSVTIPVTSAPQAIPYEVTDSDGATGAALIYVPGAGSGLPFVKLGTLIEVPQNGQVSKAIGDYVVSPSGRPVIATTNDRMWASPAGGVGVAAESPTTLQVKGLADYIGPGAITLEVTDGAALDDPAGKRAIVTIPVQVGPLTPVLRCPTDPIKVVEGGNPVTLDVTSLCHVWVPDPTTLPTLGYSAEWKTPIDSVRILGSGEHRIKVVAAGAAKPGATGQIQVSVAGSKSVPALIPIVVVGAPKPTFAPVKLEGIKQGDTATVQLAQYMRSQLIDPVYKVVGVRQTAGQPATSTFDGGTVKLTPAGTSFGTMTFQVLATDITDTTRLDRQVNGTVTLVVYGIPDAPANVRPDPALQSHAATLAWNIPDNHGAPIDQYRLTGGGQTKICQASPCTITGVPNGSPITFTVEAHNKAGWSKPSAPSAPFTPNEVPHAVTGLTASNPVDHGLTLTWAAAVVDGTPVQQYRVSWTGGGSMTVPGGTTSAAPGGLVNNNVYDFTVVPVNAAGIGPATTTKGQSSGAPGTPVAPTIGSTETAGGAQAVVTLSWAAVDPNGPKPVTYTVNRTGGSGPKVICANVQATTCQDSGVVYDGTTYQYAVTATNATGGSAHSSTGPARSFQATGTPAAWGSWTIAPTGSDNQARMNYTVPASRGATSSVTWLLNGSSAGALPAASTAGQSFSSQAISVPQDGTNYTIALRVCNEANRCTTSSPQNVNTYGPIPAPSISLSKDGPTTFQVHVSADGNGRSIQVHVWTDTGHVYDVSTTMAGNWNFGGYGVNYSQSDRAHVTITDSAGRGVPGQVDSNSQTADPPPPTVALSWGGYKASGRTIVSTASNFQGSVRCYVHDSDGTPSSASGSNNPPTFAYWNQGNGAYTTINWWGASNTGKSVWIACDNGAQSAHWSGGSPP